MDKGHSGLAQVLGTNAFANGLFNVNVIHAVAGPEEKLSRFPSISLAAKGNFGSLGMHNVGLGSREANVRMCTLDEIAPANTAFVKIDVEGFEPSVLAGATKVLNDIRPAWLIETGTAFEEAARKTISIMMEAGYDVYWLFVPFVTYTATKGVMKSEFEGDWNIVAVAKGGANPWNLEPLAGAHAPRPTQLSELRYLSRFGFNHGLWKTVP